jgi:hypothetical protein
VRFATTCIILSNPRISSRHIPIRPPNTRFCAQLQPITNAQSPHSQGAGWNTQQFHQAFAVFDLQALVALIVVQNEFASFGRKLAETPPQAVQAPFRITFGFRRGHARLRCLFQRARLFGPLAAHFPKKHAGDADAVGWDISDLLAIGDLFRAPVNRFVGRFVWCGASPPFEEADEVMADLEITLSGCLTIGAEGIEQSVERLLRESPLLPDGTGLPRSRLCVCRQVRAVDRI